MWNPKTSCSKSVLLPHHFLLNKVIDGMNITCTYGNEGKENVFTSQTRKRKKEKLSFSEFCVSKNFYLMHERKTDL